jgi:hypothetical protein
MAAGRLDARAERAIPTTTSGVKRYLRSIGVDPTGVVIQRGRLNYAGPHCPGSGWTCTSARKVIQIQARGRRAATERTLAGPSAAAGENRVECDPGVASDPGPDFPAPGAFCLIRQVAAPGTDNVATCTIEFTAPGATQGCDVQQINSTGRNRTVVRQGARQVDSLKQLGFESTSSLVAASGT